MDTKNISRPSVRVGANEGIIVSLDNLNKITLYTSGLTGCAALVVADDKNVFMAHIMAVNKKEKTENTYKSAKEYIMEVINWMKNDNKNGGEGGIQIFLGTSDKKLDVMFEVFKTTCEKFIKNNEVKNCSFAEMSNTGNGSYKVKFNNIKNVVEVESGNETANKEERKSWIKHRINAYAFGEVSSGSDNNEEREKDNSMYNEEFIKYSESHQLNDEELKKNIPVNDLKIDDEKAKKILEEVGENWNKNKNLSKVTIDLCNAAGAGYGKNLLKQIDSHIKKFKNILVTEQNRIDICNELILKLKNNETPKPIEIVNSVLSILSSDDIIGENKDKKNEKMEVTEKKEKNVENLSNDDDYISDDDKEEKKPLKEQLQEFGKGDLFEQAIKQIAGDIFDENLKNRINFEAGQQGLTIDDKITLRAVRVCLRRVYDKIIKEKIEEKENKNTTTTNTSNLNLKKEEENKKIEKIEKLEYTGSDSLSTLTGQLKSNKNPEFLKLVLNYFNKELNVNEIKKNGDFEFFKKVMGEIDAEALRFINVTEGFKWDNQRFNQLNSNDKGTIEKIIINACNKVLSGYKEKVENKNLNKNSKEEIKKEEKKDQNNNENQRLSE